MRSGMTTSWESTKKWRDRFWLLAKTVSEWSKDAAKVGAIVVTKRGGAIAMGFNGFPVGVEDRAERLTDRETKLEMIIHAEQNALLIAGKAAMDAELYVWGKPICAKCAGVIIQAGIRKVVCTDPKKVDKDSKWRPTGLIGIKMLREAGVQILYRAP
jgi:dCMP deaminase